MVYNIDLKTRRNTLRVLGDGYSLNAPEPHSFTGFEWVTGTLFARTCLQSVGAQNRGHDLRVSLGDAFGF